MSNDGWSKRAVRLCLAALALLCTAPAATAAGGAVTFDAGFAKVDVTPQRPVRMSGYAGRDRPSEGVDTALHARAMALRPAGGETFVLVAFDVVGVPASFTEHVAKEVAGRFGVPRERFVLCVTHTHAGPHLPIGITNIFNVPMTDEELRRGTEYVEYAKGRIVEVVGKAVEDLKPAVLSRGTGKANFAANRRVLKDGQWERFGVNPDGPVDPTVDVLKVASPDGHLRGVVFNYACHATTLGMQHYRLNGDWPAYAAQQIEAENPRATALCTIGCGADANPEPRGKLEQSQAHGRALAGEVGRALKSSELSPVTVAPKAAFGHAELKFELPTVEQLKARLNDPSPPVARQAKSLLASIEKGEPPPASYPDPVQVWRFGDELTMVFLGGETVVDYALRLKREVDARHLWVTAYANDVFAYVASERVRREGGYEVAQSMVFYNRPGPWAAGTEEVLIRRAHELITQAGGKPPRQSPR